MGAHHQLLHPLLSHQPGHLGGHHLRLPALDDGGIPGQQAGGIGDRHAGAGVPVQEVNRLLKQFEQTQDMMKRMKRGGLGKMMRALGQLGRGGFPGMGSFGR